jgi:hypothetical protein
MVVDPMANPQARFQGTTAVDKKARLVDRLSPRRTHFNRIPGPVPSNLNSPLVPQVLHSGVKDCSTPQADICEIHKKATNSCFSINALFRHHRKLQVALRRSGKGCEYTEERVSACRCHGRQKRTLWYAGGRTWGNTSSTPPLDAGCFRGSSEQCGAGVSEYHQTQPPRRKKMVRSQSRLWERNRIKRFARTSVPNEPPAPRHRHGGNPASLQYR